MFYPGRLLPRLSYFLLFVPAWSAGCRDSSASILGRFREFAHRLAARNRDFLTDCAPPLSSRPPSLVRSCGIDHQDATGFAHGGHCLWEFGPIVSPASTAGLKINFRKVVAVGLAPSGDAVLLMVRRHSVVLLALGRYSGVGVCFNYLSWKINVVSRWPAQKGRFAAISDVVLLRMRSLY